MRGRIDALLGNPVPGPYFALRCSELANLPKVGAGSSISAPVGVSALGRLRPGVRNPSVIGTPLLPICYLEVDFANWAACHARGKFSIWLDFIGATRRSRTGDLLITNESRGPSPSITIQQHPREMGVLFDSRSVVIGPVRS